MKQIFQHLIGVMISILCWSGCTQDTLYCQSLDDCPQAHVCRVNTCVQLSTGAGTNTQPNMSSNNTFVVQPHQTTNPTDDMPDLETGLDMGTTDACQGDTPLAGELVIHEALMSVPTGAQGDANGDGKRDAYDDEFVELLNTSDKVLQLRGVQFGVGQYSKYTFADRCLKPSHGIVIFGGPRGAPERQHEGATILVGAARLGMSNQGGQLWIKNAQQHIIFRLNYDAPREQSYTLSPQFSGSRFVPHTTNHDTLFSPGWCADGQALTSKCLPLEVDMSKDMLVDMNSDL